MQDFLHGRSHFAPQNPAARLDLAASRSSPHAPPLTAEPPRGERPPQVEIVAEDGRPERIIITCACGEHINLQCVY